METTKSLLVKIGIPVVLTFMLSKPLAGLLVAWGACVVNNDLCIGGIQAGVFIVIILIVGLSIDMIRAWHGAGIRITVIDNEYDPHGAVNDVGLFTYAGLRIENTDNAPIVDCTGTLECIEPVYFVDEQGTCIDPDPQIVQILQQRGLFRPHQLRWTHNKRSDSSCKISIPGRSKETVLYVAQLLAKHTWDKNNNHKYTEELEFASCVDSSSFIYGLYRFTIRLNGTRRGKDLQAYFKGYLYTIYIRTPMDDGTTQYTKAFFIKQGDPADDTSIIANKRTMVVHNEQTS